jgi:hypothetical protein
VACHDALTTHSVATAPSSFGVGGVTTCPGSTVPLERFMTVFLDTPIGRSRVGAKKMKTSLLAMAAVLALAGSADAQQPQPPTVKYIYEWVHVRVGGRLGQGQPFAGVLFMGDVTSTTGNGTNESILDGYIHNAKTGEVILDCNLAIGRQFANDDIVQVGPFAQEAHGDASRLLESPDATFGPGARCLVPPANKDLTIDCEFQGQQISTAPGHHTFTHSGTFNQIGKNSFTQRGQHGPTQCTLVIDGVEYETHGFLTRINETRIGLFLSPTPMWQEPRGWLMPADLRCAASGPCN